MALAQRHPGADLPHHSDRGTQFPAERYQATLREAGIEISMSRTANWWDNAAMKVRANDSLEKHAKAILSYDDSSSRPLILLLIRSTAILQSNIVELPDAEGAKRSAVAVAHTILVIIYHLLSRQTTYQEKGETFFEELDRQGKDKHLVRQLSGLGYHVELRPAPLAG